MGSPAVGGASVGGASVGGAVVDEGAARRLHKMPAASLCPQLVPGRCQAEEATVAVDETPGARARVGVREPPLAGDDGGGARSERLSRRPGQEAHSTRPRVVPEPGLLRQRREQGPVARADATRADGTGCPAVACLPAITGSPATLATLVPGGLGSASRPRHACHGEQEHGRRQDGQAPSRRRREPERSGFTMSGVGREPALDGTHEGWA